MFKQINQWLRTAAILGATAATLVACGGGEGLPLKKIDEPEQNACTATSDCAVSMKTATAFQYGAGAAGGAVATNANDYTITGTRTDLTETWGAVVGQLKLTAAKDVSAYKSLKLSLTSSSNNEVTLMLVSADAKQDCYPTYKATGLSATAKSFTIALSDFKLANNPNPAVCAPDKTTDPDTVAALKKVTEIQVREIKGTAGDNAVKVVVGKPLLWSNDGPVVETPPPNCSSTSGGNVPVCTSGAFQYGVGAAAGAVASNANDYTITGTRTDTSVAGSTVAGQFNLYAPQDVSSYNSLKLSLASSSNSEVTLMLMSSGAKNECYPSYKATGLSATAKNFTIALTDFKLANNPDQGKCAKTTDPDTADALKNVTGLQVREIKGAAGKNAVNVVVGKPLQWSTESPKVVEPPTQTTTAVVVTNISAGGFGDSTEDANKSFTDTAGKGPWLLTGTRSSTAVDYSTVRGVLEATAPTGVKTKTSLSFTLASTQNQTILVRIKAIAGDQCSPSYIAKISTANAGAFTVPLSEFKRSNDPSGDATRNYAACDATNNPGTAADMTTFYGIEINDRNKIGADTTGGATINVTLIKLNWVVDP